METKPTIQIYRPGELTAEAFANDVPMLYHYTGEAGLEGMLQSRSLWFSNIHDQNDTAEFIHAEELVRQVLAEDYPGLSLRGSIRGALTGDGKTPIYTCSMSSAEDLLSQWRGYCHNGGVSYSIQKEQLHLMISGFKLILAKCIYDDEEKKGLIRDLIGVTPEGYKRHKDRRVSYPADPSRHPILSDSTMHSKYLVEIRRNLATYAAIMKHKAFKEEQEWRLITSYDYRNELNRGAIQAPSIHDIFPYFIPHKTRPYLNRTIDYVELPLAYNPAETPNGIYPHNPLSQLFFHGSYVPKGEALISKVIISPTGDKETIKVKWQQRLQGHGNPDVENSEIPYRNW